MTFSVDNSFLCGPSLKTKIGSHNTHSAQLRVVLV